MAKRKKKVTIAVDGNNGFTYIGYYAGNVRNGVKLEKYFVKPTADFAEGDGECDYGYIREELGPARVTVLNPAAVHRFGRSKSLDKKMEE